MRSDITTIITGTYNKHEFLPDAAASVLNQTCDNWRWWIILDDAEENTKELAYEYANQDSRITCFEEKLVAPWTAHKEIITARNPYSYNREAHIRNIYFPRVGTKYLSWLSDDDILEPCFIEALTCKLEETGGDVAFGYADVLIKQQGQWQTKRWHNPECNLGLGQPLQPFTIIDGGQMLQTKRSYDALGWKFEQSHTPNLLDAIYMTELAKHYVFYRVPVKVYRKRMTYLSTYEQGEK